MDYDEAQNVSFYTQFFYNNASYDDSEESLQRRESGRLSTLFKIVQSVDSLENDYDEIGRLLSIISVNM